MKCMLNWGRTGGLSFARILSNSSSKQEGKGCERIKSWEAKSCSTWLIVRSAGVDSLGRAPAAEFRLKREKLGPGCEGSWRTWQATDFSKWIQNRLWSTGMTQSDLIGDKDR